MNFSCEGAVVLLEAENGAGLDPPAWLLRAVGVQGHGWESIFQIIPRSRAAPTYFS